MSLWKKINKWNMRKEKGRCSNGYVIEGINILKNYIKKKCENPVCLGRKL